MGEKQAQDYKMLSKDHFGVVPGSIFQPSANPHRQRTAFWDSLFDGRVGRDDTYLKSSRKECVVCFVTNLSLDTNA